MLNVFKETASSGPQSGGDEMFKVFGMRQKYLDNGKFPTWRNRERRMPVAINTTATKQPLFVNKYSVCSNEWSKLFIWNLWIKCAYVQKLKYLNKKEEVSCFRIYDICQH